MGKSKFDFMNMNRIVIIGLGLIGGSLAMALKESGFKGEIVGIGRRKENLIKASEMGMIDRYFTNLADGVKDADMVILDAQYTPEEIKERRGWGHSDHLSALELAIASRARRLVLFHHDPSRKDSEVDLIVSHCREIAAGKQSDILIDAAEEDSLLIC